MSYFKNFPNVQYKVNNEHINIVDISKRVMLSKVDTSKLLDYYVKDGETPEMIAHKLYDNAEYAAIILSVNGISNIYEDWALSNRQLEQYIIKKYQREHINDTHHYENSEGIIVDFDSSKTLYSVSNYEYEEKLNNEKRHIKLLIPEKVDSFIKQQYEYFK